MVQVKIIHAILDKAERRHTRPYHRGEIRAGTLNIIGSGSYAKGRHQLPYQVNHTLCLGGDAAGHLPDLASPKIAFGAGYMIFECLSIIFEVVPAPQQTDFL